MNTSLKFLTLIFVLQAGGCAQLMPHRSLFAGMEDGARDYFTPEEDFPVMAGDTGLIGTSAKERKARGPASTQEVLHDRNRMALEHELLSLEGEQTEANYQFYKKHRHKLTTTSEKIYFLKLPVRERRDYLYAKGVEQSGPGADYTEQEEAIAIRQSDILIGMTKDEVLESWGRPMRVEIAGNPNFENERWVYELNGASKLIYFESGRVEGWE